MNGNRVLIKRYPNRRFYSHETSKYVSLGEIEELVSAGRTVEIRDSQTGENLTRPTLTQIIMERHPEKMALFPAPMLHLILQANEMMSDFLRGYFRDSLTYLEYLQQHGGGTTFSEPMHWLKAWLDGLTPKTMPLTKPPTRTDREAELEDRISELEQRLRQLEGGSG